MAKTPTIDYDILVQNALKMVIRDVMKNVAANGMPDEHHFLITFATNHPGVKCPAYIVEEHPEEITIILQHEYEDLQVFDDHFKVTLGFDEQDEELTVPYDAIICFVDPYVKFGLHFDDPISPAPAWDEAHVSGPEETDSHDNVVNLEDFRRKKD